MPVSQLYSSSFYDRVSSYSSFSSLINLIPFSDPTRGGQLCNTPKFQNKEKSISIYQKLRVNKNLPISKSFLLGKCVNGCNYHVCLKCLKIFLNPNHAFLDQRETKQKKIKSRGVHI
jgi:hypothetical protein